VSMGRFRLRSLLDKSAAVRLGARGVVFTLVTYVLVDVALEIQAHVANLSRMATAALVAGLVLMEASVFMCIKMMFKRVR
jgi:hypothetical protein